MAVHAAPAEVGGDLANWNWRVVRPFIQACCGIRLNRATCLRYLHRLGFAYKRPKKRLLKDGAAKRAAFTKQYAAFLMEARVTGAKVCFVDEAHFRADADLHGQWVLKGQPALVDPTWPRWGEEACLETGETAYMGLTGTSSAATSAPFLTQLRDNHAGPLVTIWDNSPVHGGEARRTSLDTPNMDTQICRLPAYSPVCNADEAS